MNPFVVDGIMERTHSARVVVLRLAEQLAVAALLERHRLVEVDRAAFRVRQTFSQAAHMIADRKGGYHGAEIDKIWHGIAFELRVRTD